MRFDHMLLIGVARQLRPSKAVVTKSVTFRLTADQHSWLMLVTGEARMKDRTPLDVSTVCREALDHFKASGGYAQHRIRLLDRHAKESRRGPKGA